MSLRKWAENGWLKQQDTNSSEIKMLLGVVERDLADAQWTKSRPICVSLPHCELASRRLTSLCGPADTVPHLAAASMRKPSSPWN